MSFIKSFSIDIDGHSEFPFSIPAVKFARHVLLDKRVTIFVGENGSGKSTLLECIALQMNLPIIDRFIDSAAGLEAAKALQPHLRVEWNQKVKKGFFFRAEDFSDFVNAEIREKGKVEEVLREFKGQVDEALIREMQRRLNDNVLELRRSYVGNIQHFSHGEAYLKIIQARIGDKGIYLLDEPEAALSPLKQLSLIAYILDVLQTGTAQFIIATHSPILMGIPGAMLYEIQEDDMRPVQYRETEHYRITKTFLENPELYLRYLFFGQ